MDERRDPDFVHLGVNDIAAEMVITAKGVSYKRKPGLACLIRARAIRGDYLPASELIGFAGDC